MNENIETEDQIKKIELEIRELVRFKGLIETVFFRSLLVGVIIFIIVYSSWNSLFGENGKYIVYACNDTKNCYLLQADIETDEGITRVEKLYFNNGGSIDLDCVIGDYCYEDEGSSWDITMIKKIN